MAGKARVRKLAKTALRGVRAYGGDPRAAARLVASAARRAPTTTKWLLAGAVVGLVAMMVLASAARNLVEALPFGVRAPAIPNIGGVDLGAGSGLAPAGGPVSSQMWMAYQIAASVVCWEDGSVAVWSSREPPPPGGRVDWRLVAAVGQVETGHGLGVGVNAFGDTLHQLVVDAGDGGADTDGGRFDGSAGGDFRSGPMGLLPSQVVSDGVDGNGDGIADPHNVWDAAATVAGGLCVRGVSADPARALLRWRPDREWAEAVLAVWADLARLAPETAGVVPAGAPLAYTPTAPGVAPTAGPVLMSLIDRWGGGPTPRVECAGGVCGWRLGFVPEGVDEWVGLRRAGFGAPVPVPRWGVTVSGDPTRHDRIPAWHPLAGLSWPLPSSPPPQPGGYDTPPWWTFHLPPAAEAWTAPTDGYQLGLGTVAGAMVFSPTDGIAEYHAGGCAEVTDSEGGMWKLCGVRAQPSSGAPPRTGPLQRLLRDWGRLVVASGIAPPVSLISLGTFSCRTVAGSETWSQHSWNNAVDIATDIDGNLTRDPHDMDSAATHNALSNLVSFLTRTMANPQTRILEDGSTLVQDQAPRLGGYQIRNVIFNLGYQPGGPVNVTRHDEHVHVDFWVGAQPAAPACTPHEVAAGDLLGVASGTVTVEVFDPDGGSVCPQILFAAWRAGDPLTPAGAAPAEPPDETDESDDETDETDDEEEGCDE